MIGSIRDPIEENMAKMLELERERIEKGLTFNAKNQMAFPIHVLIDSAPPKQIMIVDCEPEDVARWLNTYGSLVNAKFHPLMPRSEYEKLQK